VVRERCFSDELFKRLAEGRVANEDALTQQRDALAGCDGRPEGPPLANRCAWELPNGEWLLF